MSSSSFFDWTFALSGLAFNFGVWAFILYLMFR